MKCQIQRKENKSDHWRQYFPHVGLHASEDLAPEQLPSGQPHFALGTERTLQRGNSRMARLWLGVPFNHPERQVVRRGVGGELLEDPTAHWIVWPKNSRRFANTSPGGHDAFGEAQRLSSEAVCQSGCSQDRQFLDELLCD